MTTISGTDLAASLPEGRTAQERQAREDAIVKAFADGHHLPLVWLELRARIDTENADHFARFFVLRDALQLGIEGDSFRPNVTAYGQQRIAEMAGAVLPTSRLVELAWEQGFWISPSTLTPDDEMAFTHRMVQHSRDVDAKVRTRHELVAGNVGKHWVLTNRTKGKIVQGAPAAANFGWARNRSAPFNPWQPESTGHNVLHVDYSQVCWLVRRDAILDGSVIDIEEIGRDAELCKLLHYEPLEVWHVPDPKPAKPKPDPIPEIEDRDPPSNAWREVLKKGMSGADVGAWQRQLMSDGHSLDPWRDDEDFGKCTHNQTVAWQSVRGLKKDGEVGPRTRAMIGTKPIELPELPRDPRIAFKQAKNYTTVPVSSPRLIDTIVLHSMEAAETSTTAEAVASWFAGSQAPKASTHYNLDDDSTVQSVLDKDVAWCAPGRNRTGLHFEHAGYARQTREQWLDAFSSRMLARSARLAAQKCVTYGIPPVYIDREGLKRNKRGITTHHEVTFAFRKSDHTDPGKHFPMDHYLDLVKEEIARLGAHA